MKSLSIIFSTPKRFNLFSSLIKWGLKTPFSHAAIVIIDNDTNENIVFQASSLFVNCITETAFLKKEKIIAQFDFELSENAFIKTKKFCIESLGTPYDIWGILGFFIQIILRIFGIKINNPLANKKAEWCSEFVFNVCEHLLNINLGIWRNMDPETLFLSIPKLPKKWD